MIIRLTVEIDVDRKAVEKTFMSGRGMTKKETRELVAEMTADLLKHAFKSELMHDPQVTVEHNNFSVGMDYPPNPEHFTFHPGPPPSSHPLSASYRQLVTSTPVSAVPSPLRDYFRRYYIEGGRRAGKRARQRTRYITHEQAARNASPHIAKLLAAELKHLTEMPMPEQRTVPVIVDPRYPKINVTDSPRIDPVIQAVHNAAVRRSANPGWMQ